MRTCSLVLATLLAASLLAGPAAVASNAPATRAEAPIREVVLSDGARRYAVPIRIGGSEIEAGLDSGSTGLRILPGAVTAADETRGRERSDYSYESGARLEGVVAQGTLTIGAASAPITFQAIEAVGCTAQKPRCPASRVAPAAYGIQGDGLPGEGFKAILGINMADAEVANPLRALGARRWIIELPLPGGGRPGRLILNPTAEETAGFVTFPIERRFAAQHGGMHDGLPACLTNSQTRQQFCGPALLDTGAPGVEVINGRGAPWPNQTPAEVAFGDQGAPRTSAAFQIGRRDFASRLTYVPAPVDDVRLHLGLLPYFAYDVLYDPEAGAVGLRPRPDTAMSVR